MDPKDCPKFPHVFWHPNLASEGPRVNSIPEYTSVTNLHRPHLSAPVTSLLPGKNLKSFMAAVPSLTNWVLLGLAALTQISISSWWVQSVKSLDRSWMTFVSTLILIKLYVCVVTFYRSNWFFGVPLMMDNENRLQNWWALWTIKDIHSLLERKKRNGYIIHPPYFRPFSYRWIWR